MISVLIITLFLFLLSADRMAIVVGGANIKIGYLMVFFFWLHSFFPMLKSALNLVKKPHRRPNFLALIILLSLLVIPIILSVNSFSSVLWLFWLGFNLFCAFTVYLYLQANQISSEKINLSALIALGLIVSFAFYQFIAVYQFHFPIFSPQHHNNLFRINGLSGWPHFFNIYCFLLLPFVLFKKNTSLIWFFTLAVTSFTLIQSTAKTGWMLFLGMGLLLVFFDLKIFTRRYLLYLVPLTFFSLIIPTPSYQVDQKASSSIRGFDKVTEFASDLNPSQPSSGMDRVIIAKMGLTVWMKHPWFGIGPRSYETYVKEHFDQELPGKNNRDVNGDLNLRNENIWIEFLAENGILFVLALISLIVYLLRPLAGRNANPLTKSALISLLLYYGISGQFSQNGLLTLPFVIWGIYFYSQQTNESLGV